MLSILSQFPSTQSQHVMVDCCRSKLTNITSGVPPQCFGPVIVPPVDFRAFFHTGDRLTSYADDFTWIAVVPSSGISYSSRVPKP